MKCILLEKICRFCSLRNTGGSFGLVCQRKFLLGTAKRKHKKCMSSILWHRIGMLYHLNRLDMAVYILYNHSCLCRILLGMIIGTDNQEDMLSFYKMCTLYLN
jgi:hypothetical protein